MPTVEEVARDVIASIDTAADHVLAGRWVGSRYRQLANQTRMKHLRRVGALTLPASITAGLATVARGSSTVTGDSTAQAAWIGDLKGRWFRASTVWYEIENVVDSALQLVEPYAEGNVSAGGYNVVARHVVIPKEARWPDLFVHMRRRVRVETLPTEFLDAIAPERNEINDVGPSWVAEVGADHKQNAGRLVEFYPYVKTNAELIHYVYWAEPSVLALEDEIPQNIPDYVLREGALIDAMRYESGLAMRNGQVEQAAFWRNEYRAQNTHWERIRLDAFRTDDGIDDLVMFLKESGITFRGQGDIRNARDEIWARGARP